MNKKEYLTSRTWPLTTVKVLGHNFSEEQKSRADWLGLNDYDYPLEANVVTPYTFDKHGYPIVSMPDGVTYSPQYLNIDLGYVIVLGVGEDRNWIKDMWMGDAPNTEIRDTVVPSSEPYFMDDREEDVLFNIVDPLPPVLLKEEGADWCHGEPPKSKKNRNNSDAKILQRDAKILKRRKKKKKR